MRASTWWASRTPGVGHAAAPHVQPSAASTETNHHGGQQYRRHRHRRCEGRGDRTAALLGSKLVAYLDRSTDTNAVNGWCDGTVSLPDSDILERLRIALDAAQFLTQRDTAAVAQTWFQGRNPALGDRAPAQVLRDTDLDGLRSSILDAASEFATHRT
jgi:hypothetical protein